jgi:hypothetical protein
MKLSRMLMAGAAGAALAYFLDPQAGPRRRALAKDRMGAALRRGTRAAERRAEYSAKEVASAPAAAVSAVKPAPDYDDGTLTEKVKTELFKDPAINGQVNVSTQNGVVVLIGEVDDPEMIVARTKAVKGVGPVRSLLHRPGTPAPHMA